MAMATAFMAVGWAMNSFVVTVCLFVIKKTGLPSQHHNCALCLHNFFEKLCPNEDQHISNYNSSVHTDQNLK
jgi:hypothetical protein